MDRINEINAVPPALAAWFAGVTKAAVAFSGGADSSYLLYAARACKIDVHAYCVHSQFQPAFELEHARRLAAEVDVPLTVIPVDVLANEAVAANPPDRCYHCKRVVFGEILNAAAGDGYPVILDGSNASDDASDRPGMRALNELEVRSPLREAGLTKAEVRRLSREAGLFTWDKPAYACLATRVPAGVPLDGDTLDRIEGAEDALARLGFTDYRARVLGDAAKLQLPAGQIPLAAERREEIIKALSPWFGDIYLDLTSRKSD